MSKWIGGNSKMEHFIFKFSAIRVEPDSAGFQTSKCKWKLISSDQLEHFLTKPFVVTKHRYCLFNVILMIGHNIRFGGEMDFRYAPYLSSWYYQPTQICICIKTLYPALQISMHAEQIFWHNFFISSPNPIEISLIRIVLKRRF